MFLEIDKKNFGLPIGEWRVGEIKNKLRA